MIELVWDEGFKRSYKKRISNNQLLKKKFWEAIDLFIEQPFDPKLKTHKLSGKLDGLWAFSVAYDSRVVFKFIQDNNCALLIDIGTHDEVY
jgi:addiction module RelE/StbE family toxin